MGSSGYPFFVLQRYQKYASAISEICFSDIRKTPTKWLRWDTFIQELSYRSVRPTAIFALCNTCCSRLFDTHFADIRRRICWRSTCALFYGCSFGFTTTPNVDRYRATSVPYWPDILDEIPRYPRWGTPISRLRFDFGLWLHTIASKTSRFSWFSRQKRHDFACFMTVLWHVLGSEIPTF